MIFDRDEFLLFNHCDSKMKRSGGKLTLAAFFEKGNLIFRIGIMGVHSGLLRIKREDNKVFVDADAEVFAKCSYPHLITNRIPPQTSV